jgi:ELWxxDGT repeat protein
VLGPILKPDGASCGNSNECLSEAGCVDGVCCKSACPKCRACAAGTGECTTVVASAPDPDSCTGTDTCDASGACKKATGQTCAAAGECASNVCADGVCCNATCDGICRSCNLAGSIGTCSPVVNGEDDTCLTSPATGVNVCNAMGVCVQPRLVADVSPGPGSGLGFSGFELRSVAASGLTFFRGINAAGEEPWVSDGTMAGTFMLKDIKTTAPSNSLPSAFTPMGGAMYFIATDNDGVRKLWKSDGTTAGTVVVKEPSAGGPIMGFGVNSDLIVFQNQLFFAAFTNSGPLFANGVELWKSDGTAAGTVQVQDLIPGNFSSSPHNFAIVGNRLVFSAMTRTLLSPANIQVAADEELVGTDGTTVQLVKDINPEPNWPSNSLMGDIVVTGGKGYFAAYSGNVANIGTELWVTDGTPGGTMLVKDIYPGSAGSSPTNLRGARGILYFTACDFTSVGCELFRSDGTTAGTTVVADIQPGTNSSHPGPVESVGPTGDIYFSAFEIFSTTSKRSLYRSNGTSGATVVPVSTSANPSPSSLTGFGRWLAFGAFNDANQYELWVLDPSTNMPFTACKGGSTGCFIPNVGNAQSVLQVRANNRLWFPADQRATGGIGFEPFVFP